MAAAPLPDQEVPNPLLEDDTGPLPDMTLVEGERMDAWSQPDEELETPFTTAYFSPIHLDPASEPPDMPRPKLRALFDVLERERILLIGGIFPDKRRLARLCAAEWAELQSERPGEAATGKRVTACEIRPSSDPKNVLLELDERRDPAVFVLTQLEPYHVNRNLEGLRRAAGARHWVILTTDRNAAAWQLSRELAAAWYEPKSPDLYAPGDLARYLATCIQRARQEAIQQGAPLHERALPDLRLAGEALATPEAVERFACQWVQQLRTTGSGVSVEELVARATDASEAMQRWFSHSLSPREQLVALGLGFFDQLE